jgi:type II restriction enzyme
MSDKKTEYDHDGQQSLETWRVCDSNNTKIQSIIDICKRNQFLYKFISANDAGKTGSHQSGIYLPNSSWSFYFDSPGVKGRNKDRFVTIRWEKEEIETESRFIWYGEKTRSEYRLTRFGKGFPYLKDEFIGSLIIIVKTGEEDFSGWILDSDSEIENFLARFNISHLDKGGICCPEGVVQESEKMPEDRDRLFAAFVRSLKKDFPETAGLAEITRTICAKGKQPAHPDERLVHWLDAEYQLFRLIENKMYDPFITEGNHSLEDILAFCGSVLNRRKSRAGKSLEHHLAAIFDEANITYSHGEITEEHSRPDFIFPGISRYRDPGFASDHLVFLGSKTTCKDRWRQILTEAKRIDRKHLFTLQQGISSNQLNEMEREHVTLVIPKQNINSFPEPWRPKLMTLDTFIRYIRATAG